MLINWLILTQDREFVWADFKQGIILSSFQWGYIITQIQEGIWLNYYFTISTKQLENIVMNIPYFMIVCVM